MRALPLHGQPIAPSRDRVAERRTTRSTLQCFPAVKKSYTGKQTKDKAYEGGTFDGEVAEASE